MPVKPASRDGRLTRCPDAARPMAPRTARPRYVNGVTEILNRASCLAILLACRLYSAGAARAEQAAQPCAAGDAPGRPVLHVLATDARPVAGNVTFTLYGKDPARFLKSRGSLLVIRVPLAGSSAEACFSLSEPGTYAVAVYHDANGNHHFDRNFLGLPAEAYGFSNDAPTLLGPPGFDAVRIAVHPGDNSTRIRLHD